MADQWAAVGFLDDRCEDYPVIDQRCIRSVLDGVVDVLDDFGRVVVASVEPAARVLESVEVGIPHVVERDPFVTRREVRGVALVVSIGICARSGANAGVVDALACGAAFFERDGIVDLCCGRCVLESSFARKRNGESNDDY